MTFLGSIASVLHSRSEMNADLRLMGLGTVFVLIVAIGGFPLKHQCLWFSLFLLMVFFYFLGFCVWGGLFTRDQQICVCNFSLCLFWVWIDPTL